MANPSYDGLTTPALNGTTIKVPAGLYSGFSIGRLKNAVIDLSSCTFSGPGNFYDLDGCTVIRGIHAQVKGIARNLQGFCRHTLFIGATFTGCDQVYDIADKNRIYDGTDDSLNLNTVTFALESQTNCGFQLLGGYGAGSDASCYNDTVAWKDSTVLDTNTNGTLIRATIFNLQMINVKISYKKNGGVNPILGDVGSAYISGSFYGEGVVQDGGRGYIVRVWHTNRKRKNADGTIEVLTKDTTIKNCVKKNTTTYGTGDLRPDVADGTWSKRGGNFYVINNTAINQGDSIGYWSTIAVIGDLAYAGGAMRCYVKDNLGANISTIGQGGGNAPKPPIAMQQGGNNWLASDESGSVYLTKVDGVIDPVTGYKLMPDKYPGIGATPYAGVISTIPTGTVVTPPVVVPPVVTPPVTPAKTVTSTKVTTTTTYAVLITYSDGTTETKQG